MKTPETDQSKTTSKQPAPPSKQPSKQAMEIAARLMANKAMRLAKKG